MSENQTLDDLPQPAFEGTVDPEDLETDGDNPNEMTDEQFGLLCDRMRQNGWLGGPIITNTDGLIADGEHRWRAAKEIGLGEVPVRQYDIDDATRRLWRQELNKIHGEHDEYADALEFDRLLSEGLAGPVEEIAEANDDDLDELLDRLNEENPDAGDSIAYNTTVDNQSGSGDAIDPYSEWDRSGTADDTNEDMSPEHKVVINFRNDEDLRDFEELLGREVPTYPGGIWFPAAEKLDASDKVAVESNDD